LPDAVSASSRPAELQFSIHSQAAVNFWANEIQAKSWVTIILQHGYMPEFVVLSPLYHEPNNKSSNMDIVRDKLVERVQDLILLALNSSFPLIVFWPTVSQTFFGLLTRGSCLPYLQTIVLNVNLL
jgi:hypothetical protein